MLCAAAQGHEGLQSDVLAPLLLLAGAVRDESQAGVLAGKCILWLIMAARPALVLGHVFVGGTTSTGAAVCSCVNLNDAGARRVSPRSTELAAQSND
jgi:hypothetical protein